MDRGMLFAATNPEVRKKCGDHRYTPAKTGALRFLGRAYIACTSPMYRSRKLPSQ